MTATILVAEDDRALNALVVAWLRKGGMEPEAVFDGQEAIERLRTNDYAAILLDIMMPRATGFDVIDFVRVQRPEMLGRIVVMTAGGESITSQIRSSTVCRLIQKPFDLLEVLRMARDCAVQYEAERSMKSPEGNAAGNAARRLDRTPDPEPRR